MVVIVKLWKTRNLRAHWKSGKISGHYQTTTANEESTLLKGGKAKKNQEKKQRKITRSQKKHHFWSKDPQKLANVKKKL